MNIALIVVQEWTVIQMADILDIKPVNAEMTIFKTEVEPNKLNACIDNILRRLNKLESLNTQPASPWVKVTNKLPETNAIGVAHILAYDKYEGVVKADFLDESANYINGSNVFLISNTSTQLHRVTHWMPLPDPPKEE